MAELSQELESVVADLDGFHGEYMGRIMNALEALTDNQLLDLIAHHQDSKDALDVTVTYFCKVTIMQRRDPRGLPHGYLLPTIDRYGNAPYLTEDQLTSLRAKTK